MPRLTATILGGLLAAAVASSSEAQLQHEDSLVQRFMNERSLDRRYGAWFRQYQVDPFSDSVQVHQWLTWPLNSSLTGMRQPMSVALAFMCPDQNRTFFLSGSDSTWHFPESDSWIRYRVDQNPPSTWQQGKSRSAGRFMIHVLDSAQSATRLTQIISGQQKVVIRVRQGLKGPEEDFHYLIKGFPAAYLECQAAQKQYPSGVNEPGTKVERRCRGSSPGSAVELGSLQIGHGLIPGFISKPARAAVAASVTVIRRR